MLELGLEVANSPGGVRQCLLASPQLFLCQLERQFSCAQVGFSLRDGRLVADECLEPTGVSQGRLLGLLILFSGQQFGYQVGVRSDRNGCHQIVERPFTFLGLQQRFADLGERVPDPFSPIGQRQPFRLQLHAGGLRGEFPLACQQSVPLSDGLVAFLRLFKRLSGGVKLLRRGFHLVFEHIGLISEDAQPGSGEFGQAAEFLIVHQVVELDLLRDLLASDLGLVVPGHLAEVGCRLPHIADCLVDCAPLVGGHLGEPVRDALVEFGAEDVLKYAAPVFGLRLEEGRELALREHDRLGEL